MPLSAGARLGPYQIVALLGAGGMGEVYRARDSRLNRDVALKVLPPEVAGDASRRQRFETEAQAVAALNHPNIVAVYDVGSEEGIAYIVSELVDGESLRGAKISLRKTLDIAAQVADGLACAHEAGIVHRDLKPENILLTGPATGHPGRVKILDFGLAKLVHGPAAAAREAGATLTAAQTEAGAVMGTPGYMSPEQVRGAETDHRSDVFSFGVILYELLSGRRAFQGDTSVETMTAILREEVPELPEIVPAGVRQIVSRCLEKEPRNRFQSVRDLGFALSQSATQTAGAPPGRAPTGNRRTLLALAAAGIAVCALVAGHFLWRTPAPVAWSGVPLGGPETAVVPRLAPDGHTLAFLALIDGQSQVCLMRPEAGNWSTLTHNRERGSVTALSWSPDGSRIYYDRVMDVPRGVYAVPVLGGEEQLVLEDAMLPEALPDGSLILARLNEQHDLQLFHYWPESGRLTPFPLQVYLALFQPQVRAFPDGREALVLGEPIGKGYEPGKDLYILDVATGKARHVVSRNHSTQIMAPAVTRDGQSLLFADQGPYQIAGMPRKGSSQPHTLFPLTGSTWAADTAVDGSVYLDQVVRPVSLLRFSEKGGHAVELARYPDIGDYSAQFAALPDGRAVWKQQVAGRNRLVIVENGKEPVPLSGTADETNFPVALAGPKQIAFALGKDSRTIGIASIATGMMARRIAFEKGTLTFMVSTPDGQRLYCTADGWIWMQPSNGGPATRVRAGNVIAMDPAGQYMAVIDVSQGRMRLLKVLLDGGKEQEIRIDGNARPAPVISGAISGDGKLLLGLQPPDSWFIEPAVIDLATGRATLIKIDSPGDNLRMAWTPDGQILAAVAGAQASLWKFQPEAR